jgi:DNA-binding beta-propeller fold protein YncE
MRLEWIATFGCSLLFSTRLAAGSGDLRITARFKPAGPGRIQGIAVDAEARKIYLARGAEIDILNADSGAVVGQIPVGGSISAITVVPDRKRGFAANSDANTISIFDTQSGTILKTVKLSGKAPSDITFDEGSKRIFVAIRDSGSVIVFDCDSSEIVGSVEFGGKTGSLAANGYGHLFVTAPGTNMIHVVDTNNLKALGDIPADAGKDCTGLALDPVGRRLFVSCADGRIDVIDADNGATFEELKGGFGPAVGLFTFLPTGKDGWKGAAFFANADGTLTAVKMNAFISYEVGATAKLSKGVQSIAFDLRSHHILVAAPANANNWQVLVLSQ